MTHISTKRCGAPYRVTIDEATAGLRLDAALAQLLPDAVGRPLSKAKVRKLIIVGAVYLNGSRVRIASKPVKLGARITVQVDLAKLFDDGAGRDRAFVMDESRIIYEDDVLIAVDKPPGLPTQPTLDDARDNLYAAVKKFLALRGVHYLGLHHRLDRDTSGVVLFTKDKSANAGVARLFAEHLAQKTYLAISAKAPGRVPVPAAWSVKNYLAPARKQGKRNKHASVRSGGDFAHTEFRLVEELTKGYLIEAKPKTGRTHQIRVHLSEDHLPIIGDQTYGCEQGIAPRLMLHAASLSFRHPVDGREIVLESKVPADFKECLARLS